MILVYILISWKTVTSCGVYLQVGGLRTLPCSHPKPTRYIHMHPVSVFLIFIKNLFNCLFSKRDWFDQNYCAPFKSCLICVNIL